MTENVVLERIAPSKEVVMMFVKCFCTIIFGKFQFSQNIYGKQKELVCNNMGKLTLMICQNKKD